jgi:hypothetical protein
MIKSKSKITILAITLILVLVSSNINWGRNYWKSILEADAKGYYAYLPAVFIYHDLNFGFFDKIEKETYYDKNTFYDYRAGSNGKVIDKYYCGTAIAEAPFFFMAHGLSLIVGNPADGYSQLYPIFVNIAALFYLMIGLFFLNGILKNYNIREFNRMLTLIATVFGTNLFYYTIGECGMSHVYSFAFVSMLIYYAQKYFSTLNLKYIPIIALIAGMITLIRPVNIMVLLFLPFLAHEFPIFINGIKQLLKKPLVLATSILLFLSVVFIQGMIYKISSGSFFVYSYFGEKFNFSDPNMLNILFSYKKGLFLYTPIYLISMLGLIYLFKQSRFRATAWFIPFFVITYVFSSWWNWYYGGSFSSRVFIEFIPFFMILLAIALESMKTKWKRATYISIIVVLVLVCQAQTFQYRYNVIHWSEMTQEKYWDVFLRIDKAK